MEKVVKKINKKRIIVLIISLLVVIGLLAFLIINSTSKKEDSNEEKNKDNTEEKEENNKEQENDKKEETPKEKVDILDINSKTRPLAVSINNTPVAVKVQEGLNKAYIVYEIPTEGSTSRLLALFKDTNGVKTGTIRSARHNFLDFAYESDAIFVAYGWSHYAEDEMKKGIINYVQGIVGEGGMWRDNPEKLATEHTVYANLDTVAKYAYDKKKYKKESDNTILLKYNVGDVDLSTKENAQKANKVTIPYGSVTTAFQYDENTKMYTRIVNKTVAKDHETKEAFTTKNIIVERLTYNVTDDKYYWNLHTTGSGDGYFITNGYAVPIKWSKKDRKSKTVYTYTNGEEIEVSDGRTYIEVQVTGKKTTLE